MGWIKYIYSQSTLTYFHALVLHFLWDTSTDVVTSGILPAVTEPIGWVGLYHLSPGAFGLFLGARVYVG